MQTPNLSTDFDQSQLTNLLAERALVANILMGSFPSVVLEILPDGQYFTDVYCRLIYDAAIELKNNNQTIDFTMLNSILQGKVTTESLTTVLNQALADNPLISIHHSDKACEDYATVIRKVWAMRLLYQSIKRRGVNMNEAVQSYRELTRTTGKLFSSKELASFLWEMLSQRRRNEKELQFPFHLLSHAILGLRAGQLILVASRPSVGKSSFLENVAFNLAEKNHKVLFASAEMDAESLGLRTLSRLSEIDLFRLQDIDSLSAQQQENYARALDRLNSSGLSLYDLGAMPLPQLDQLLEKEKFDAVFLDYLSLVEPARRYRSIYEKVTYASQEIKAMAVRHKIPFVVASQYNRVAANQQPILADLRDCLTGDDLIYDPIMGCCINVKDIKPKQNIVTIGRDFKLTNSTIKDIWSTGFKKIYLLKTKSGREIKSSSGHKFLSQHNRFDRAWKKLSVIKPGDKIAVVGKYPEPKIRATIKPNDALLMGWLVGDGYVGKYGAQLTVISQEEINLAQLLVAKGGMTSNVRRDNGKVAWRVEISGITDWKKSVDMKALTGKNKVVPSVIFRQPTHIINAFLKGLFHADATVATNPLPRVKLSTICRDVAYGVQHLLLRSGIKSTVHKEYMLKSGKRPNAGVIYTVTISLYEVEKFCKQIGMMFAKQKKLEEVVKNYKPRQHQRNGMIYWDTVVSITYIGKEETYDIEIDGSPYFCVNDYLVHNSGQVEQDADVVISLWVNAKSSSGDGSDRTKVFIDLLKNRNGYCFGNSQEKEYYLWFDKKRTQFIDVTFANEFDV